MNFLYVGLIGKIMQKYYYSHKYNYGEETTSYLTDIVNFPQFCVDIQNKYIVNKNLIFLIYVKC